MWYQAGPGIHSVLLLLAQLCLKLKSESEGAEDEENRCLCKYSRISQTQYSEGCFPKVSGRTVSVCIYFHMIRMGVWEAGEGCTACKIDLNKIKALC